MEATTLVHPPTRPVRSAVLRWARELAFHCVGLVTSVVGFTLWVTGVSVTLGLAVTVMGLLVALVFFWTFRWFARVERRRAALVLPVPIPERYRRGKPGAGWFARLRAAAADPATWKDFAWSGICGVLGFAISLAAVVLWGVVLGLVTLPAWYWSLPQPVELGLYRVDSLGLAFATAAIGLVLVPLCGLIVRGLTAIELAMMVPLLRPPRGEELAERVDVLTTTRAGAVDAQAAELQRIERDLHDGAQARLVALAMSLGMAEEKLDSDPEQARELLAEARGEARTALTELRDLARGIHPPILADRGLEAAITSLAARSPLAVTIEAELPTRPPAAVEAAAYFVVAEALANATKHSGARTVLVRLTLRNAALVTEIADDGRGGADAQGSGLLGLRRRVEALDGSLSVVSPAGGGTTLHAELPCGV
ncbi:MAG TPA: sensor histidine kinase [Conexibacter sp.]|jgi:signal transduction histidine kinase|nr:sensor histidine kinase [Conexibacter sp.]